MPKPRKVKDQVKDRIAKLSEPAAKRLLRNIVMSYFAGAAQQSSEDIAQFIAGDIKKTFKNIDDLVEAYEKENAVILGVDPFD